MIKTEYIICAAIHYDDKKKRKYLPLNIKTGMVFCGRRHGNCFYNLFEFKEPEPKTLTEGFLTNTNRFVNRKEAGKIALKAGQIKHKTNCLFSEDLFSEQYDKI